MLASQLLCPRDKRRIKHLFLPLFEMLVFANEDVGRQIWLFGGFEVDETRFFKDVLRADDVCFDIGGNVGYFSLLMARLAPKGFVHVFEPIPVNAALISASVELNKINNLRLSNAAVGDHEGNVRFSVSVDSAYSSMSATGRFAEEELIKVPMVSLDKYLADSSLQRIDVMKVDVEGAEELVIKGGEKVFGCISSRPRLVLMELFEGNLRTFGATVPSVIKLMASFGYSPYILRSGGRRLEAYDPLKHSKFYNIIFLVMYTENSSVLPG